MGREIASLETHRRMWLRVNAYNEETVNEIDGFIEGRKAHLREVESKLAGLEGEVYPGGATTENRGFRASSSPILTSPTQPIAQRQAGSAGPVEGVKGSVYDFPGGEKIPHIITLNC